MEDIYNATKDREFIKFYIQSSGVLCIYDEGTLKIYDNRKGVVSDTDEPLIICKNTPIDENCENRIYYKLLENIIYSYFENLRDKQIKEK